MIFFSIFDVLARGNQIEKYENAYITFWGMMLGWLGGEKSYEKAEKKYLSKAKRNPIKRQRRNI